MDTYKRSMLKRRANRKKVNANISEALSGIPTHTAGVVFDLTNGNKSHKVDRNAHVKAMELVSDLLGSFSLPIKPKLQYHGMIKNATSKDGIIQDGIIKVGAMIQTLMNHRAHIDIPVIVRDKKLLEPALFFYEEAPYVMCAPAFEQLVTRGSLQKEMQPRGMYSPPIETGISSQDLPRRPISNQPHPYTPGPRNPWTFRRHSQAEESYLIRKIKEWVPSESGPYANMTIQQIIDKDPNYARELLYTTYGLSYPEVVQELLGEPEESEELYEDIRRQGQHKGKPRKRTNIDTPVEWPELWKDDVPDHMLDPAERSRDGLFNYGAEITLQEDAQARERGGGHVIIPSGEKGIVVRNDDGTGLVVYVHFPAMGLTVMLPSRMFKKAASVDQVKHEVREMLREGYQKVDIKEAILRLYPSQAEEALKGL